MSWQSEQRLQSLLESGRSGAQAIVEERDRQHRPTGIRDGEGYNREHDYDHSNELALAAVCYATPPRIGIQRSRLWPWHRNYWKPKTRIEDLVRAGALIAAALDVELRKEREKNGISGTT